MAHVTVTPLDPHRDARGVVVEPLAPEEFAAQRNAHLVLTAPGAVRGNHRHERGTEIALVLGPALVRLREGAATRDVTVADGEALRFAIPPGVAHAFQGTGPAPMVVLSFNTEPHDPAHPDVVRDVLIPPPE